MFMMSCFTVTLVAMCRFDVRNSLLDFMRMAMKHTTAKTGMQRDSREHHE